MWQKCYLVDITLNATLHYLLVTLLVDLLPRFITYNAVSNHFRFYPAREFSYSRSFSCDASQVNRQNEKNRNANVYIARMHPEKKCVVSDWTMQIEQ